MRRNRTRRRTLRKVERKKKGWKQQHAAERMGSTRRAQPSRMRRLTPKTSHALLSHVGKPSHATRQVGALLAKSCAKQCWKTRVPQRIVREALRKARERNLERNGLRMEKQKCGSSFAWRREFQRQALLRKISQPSKRQTWCKERNGKR